jgi:hypothetical protein
MTRLFLAAGVAALAIATPAAAKPGDHGGGGGHGGGQPQAPHGGGGHAGGQFQAPRGGGGGAPHFQGFHGGGGAAPRFQGLHGGGGPRFQAQAYGGGRHGFSGPRMQRSAHFAAHAQHGGGAQHFAMARGGRNQRFAMQSRRSVHQYGGRAQLASNRGFQRQQLRASRVQQAHNQHQFRMNGVQQAQNGAQFRRQMRANRLQAQQQALTGQKFNGHNVNAQSFAANGQFSGNNGRFARNQQLALQQNFNRSHASALRFGQSSGMLPVTDVQRFVGSPVASINGFAALGPMPASMSYLYPPTPDYYYQYGDGYVYQIDRTDNIIAALIPLLAGGYLPGQYLPAPYMASYVPDYYGFNAFYPDYGGVCNRYAYGVVYQVDCYSGMVEDVIPVYASGYGVGQILPTSYAYYNVPYQYRRMYYDTSDANYWYAPGAIYQYDPRSSVITSVAALLSPGFSVGQALPVGYDVYNVPYAYRGTYYDTPTAWYRYSNGYIYQVDPATRLVTAAVASLLT